MSVIRRARHGATERGNSGRFARGFRAWILTALVASPATAQISFSPDITVDVSGVVVEDSELLVNGLASGYEPIPLPRQTELTGFDSDATGIYFSIDVTSLIDGLTVEPRDVARWNGSSVSLAVDGSAEGIPDGARIDAVYVAPGGVIALSLDTSANVAGLDFDDEDLIRLPTPVLVFDGSARGIDPSLDLNGATPLSGNVIGLSFDGSGVVDGISFDDEDVLAFDTSAGSYTLDTDGSAISSSLAPTDMTAVPEPAFRSLLGAAGLAMAFGARPRRRGKRDPQTAFAETRSTLSKSDPLACVRK